MASKGPDPAPAGGATVTAAVTVVPTVPGRRTRAARPPAGLVAAAFVVGALFASPLGYLVVRNLSSVGSFLDTALSRRALDPLTRTLLLAGSVAAAAAVIGTALAWLTTRTDVPLRRLWRVLAPLPLVIPSFVGATALLAAFGRGGLLDEILPGGDLPRPRGFVAAFVVLTLLTYPYVYLPVAARMAGLPASLEESARLLGRRPTAVFRSVVVPQISPAVWAGALLVFLYTVSDFGAVSLLRYDTLTRVIEALRLTEQAFALSLVLAVVALGVVGAERSLGRRRPITEGSRGRRPLEVPLGRWRAPAAAFAATVVGLALVAPVVVLAWWAGRGLRHDGAASLSADLGDLAEPALNTALVSVVTAVLAVAAVLPVAYLAARHRTRLAGPPNAMVVGGFALPGLVIALALGYWSLRLPAGLALYQSLPVLVLAYVVHFGAQGMRAAQVAVGSVPARLDDAARMLGAGRVRRFATIDVPLMLPGLLAGAGMVLLSTMKELPATLLLAPIGFDTLALEIWLAAEELFLAQAGLASLVLIAVSGALTWLLVIRRAERLA